jgi:hypothetical protein
MAPQKPKLREAGATVTRLSCHGRTRAEAGVYLYGLGQAFLSWAVAGRSRCPPLRPALVENNLQFSTGLFTSPQIKSQPSPYAIRSVSRKESEHPPHDPLDRLDVMATESRSGLWL